MTDPLRFLASVNGEIWQYDRNRRSAIGFGPVLTPEMLGTDYLLTWPRYRNHRLIVTLTRDPTSAMADGGVVIGDYDPHTRKLTDRVHIEADALPQPWGHVDLHPFQPRFCGSALRDGSWALFSLGHSAGANMAEPLWYLLPSPDACIDPSWTPDGDLVYIRNPAGAYSPWQRMRGLGNEVRRYDKRRRRDERVWGGGERPVWDPYVSPDGGTVAMLRRHDPDLIPTMHTTDLLDISSDSRQSTPPHAEISERTTEAEYEQRLLWWRRRAHHIADVTCSVPQWVDDSSWLVHRTVWSPWRDPEGHRHTDAKVWRYRLDGSREEIVRLRDRSILHPHPLPR